MYELIFGRRPFRGRSNSDLTHSISKDPIKWPEDAEDKCSRAGLQVVKGVSSFSMWFVKLIFRQSFLIEILRDDLAANQTVMASESYNDMPGLNPLTGKLWKTRHKHPPLSPMSVFHQLSPCFPISLNI